MCVFPRCCQQGHLFSTLFAFEYRHKFDTISEFTLEFQSEAYADVFHEENLR
jgi:hypothetical protein